MQDVDIDAAIAVQARQTLEETVWLLDCADHSDRICAVVGWVPLLAKDLSSSLDRLADRDKLVGVREIVQAQQQGFLDRPNFNYGIAELTRRNLTYDLLLRDWQLEEATRFVDRHPNQSFVLDHAAKPEIATAELDPWSRQIFAIAQRPNVFCKLSGLVTEADWPTWTLNDLRPYLDVCIEAFGPSRLMAGSDWPVCLVASSYAHWWSVLNDYLAPFSNEEINSILGATALSFYKPPPRLTSAAENHASFTPD